MRLERLQDTDYVGSEDHQELNWTVDKGDRKLSLHHPFLWDFAKRAVRILGDQYRIPIYFSEISSFAEGGAAGGSVRFLHCHYGNELHVTDWEFIDGLICDVVYCNGSSCFPEYRGARTAFVSPEEPGKWFLNGFDEFIGERR